jgi:SAM-dependent methyltransferase
MNDATKRRILNAGSGLTEVVEKLPSIFNPDLWDETRLDVEVKTEPDIVSSIVDMRAKVQDNAFDAVYSAHAIEHLHAHQVLPAFQEFRRVLKNDGFALLTCPDLAAICRLVIEKGADAVAYTSPAGPITAIDMLYGHGASIAHGYLSMAHNTAFTPERLGRFAVQAGFREVRLVRGTSYDIWALLMAPDASIESVQPIFANTILEGLCFYVPPGALNPQPEGQAAAEPKLASAEG